jgi:hypothetical protein
MVITKATWKKPASVVALAAILSACANAPQVTVSQPLSESADAPYEKILVVTLFDSFDARRYLEEEIVAHLARQDAVGVASTSMMNTKTPIVAATFIEMVDKIGADAVLLTQLTSHGANMTEKDASPQATYNYWPTYYWNVFQVELTEYVEPPRLEIEHSLILASQVFSVKSREPVWGIESRSVFVEVQEDGLDYGIFVREADAIVRHMTRDRLILR